MKLSIREDSTNYACTIVKLPPKQKVEGLDRLVKVTIFGNDILTQKDTDENQLYIFFPAECQINQEYLSKNNEFRETSLNYDKSGKPGFFEPSGRVKSIKFKGVISTGYLAPLYTLECLVNIKGFKEGDEFTTINGFDLVKKYKITRQQSTKEAGESKFNKKLKRFNKLITNQFRFHVDTAQLAKNLHLFKPEDVICITDKWHGTSAVFSNLLIKKELNWKEKVAKFFGVPILDTKYDNLYSSRSVIKNQYINTNINTNALGGYYNEDIWGVVNKELEGKIEQGISLYGEIVGYLQSGKEIQKGYSYGCDSYPKEVKMDENGNISITKGAEHKFLVYRITYTKPDGSVIEYSWNQIKNYCQKYQIEHVKELYFGKMKNVGSFVIETIQNKMDSNIIFHNEEQLKEYFFQHLQNTYLEKDCLYNPKGTPAEGVVVRVDGKDTFSAFKLKSKRFLEKESKQLDEDSKKGEMNIEDETAIDNL